MVSSCTFTIIIIIIIIIDISISSIDSIIISINV